MLIRTRIWDGKKMWYPTKSADYTWRIDRTGEVWKVAPPPDYYEPVEEKRPDAIAMLSIGMEDKNGKEVWEGDLVAFMPPETGENTQGEVQYYKGSFILYSQEKYIYCIINVMYGEVVGNAHEDK